MMVCDPKSMENSQTVRKERIRRDVGVEDDYMDFQNFDKRYSLILYHLSPQS